MDYGSGNMLSCNPYPLILNPLFNKHCFGIMAQNQTSKGYWNVLGAIQANDSGNPCPVKPRVHSEHQKKDRQIRSRYHTWVRNQESVELWQS